MHIIDIIPSNIKEGYIVWLMSVVLTSLFMIYLRSRCRFHFHLEFLGPVSKGILRQIVDVTRCKKIRDAIMIRCNILFETRP